MEPVLTSQASFDDGTNMNLFPLFNSLRIAAISTVVVFFLGLFFAYYIAKLPRILNGILDVILTLPLVLPPTVVGYLVLRLVGPRRVLGKFFLSVFGFTIPMTWWSAVIVTLIVIFPLMYRTSRGAFESFDNTLMYSGQTLGLSNSFIFWRIRFPYCRQGILAGTVLAFARALGEYELQYDCRLYSGTYGNDINDCLRALKNNQDAEAFQWVLINIAISAVVLMAVNLLERREKQKGAVL